MWGCGVDRDAIGSGEVHLDVKRLVAGIVSVQSGRGVLGDGSCLEAANGGAGWAMTDVACQCGPARPPKQIRQDARCTRSAKPEASNCTSEELERQEIRTATRGTKSSGSLNTTDDSYSCSEWDDVT